MSRSEGTTRAKKAVALQYGPGDSAPVIVASGMGYMAEKIVETAADCGVPIYEDNSLSTILTQLQLGQEVPESLYQAIVEIYVYFLHFDPTGNVKAQKPQEERGQTPPSETEETT
ncbi:MAG: type III secretion protein [Oscillibacter sp.]|jgi:flagellar biosynthesis protein|uniref:EscU/YscU/HrcU family type III secretion system export apparatus switch protein n=1 Tax=uncultured Oscillibacter sp. TaxID=876091 RepID=UPI00217222D5|nr:EscU/YscU/HrcU family type III secretion system export apparatus switch protein [uncultured Oscillibacter sp.]MCI9644991.1 type III secretion protein [Oscillibacter sp.]